MKKVAIVGVEGSGKTVILAGLGELYLRPDTDGLFLEPKNFETAAYVAEKIMRMRAGLWPVATPEDFMQGLDWTLRRRREARGRPESICRISCLDFAGEVYSAAFGVSERQDELRTEIDMLKSYVRSVDDLVVLVNLKDVVSHGVADRSVQKAMWITKNILDVALDDSDGCKPPRTAIVLSQADAYADTIRSCGGAREALERYLPYVGNNYNWLDVFAVSSVDRTELNEDGELVPVPDFKPSGLRPLMDWILQDENGVNAASDKSVARPGILTEFQDVTKAAIEAFRTGRYKEALEWSMTADQHDHVLLNCLGDYHWGIGNYTESLEWYRKAAEHGNVAAAERLERLGYGG